MKKIRLLFCLSVLLSLFVGCQPFFRGLLHPSTQPKDSVNATEHGVSPENDGSQNSKALQSLIDELSAEGGIIYIPSGEYEFAANGTQTIGDHCIKMRSNVSIVGDGSSTVLKPQGESFYGLDMFYFNEYLDTGNAVYLKNCRFEHFMIDAINTSCTYYTSAGKGFMFNLFENCHWKNVTVKNTDATGFGVDCPINSTISDCVAFFCGKAATEESTGASGFGIGFGYSENESLTITNCQANGNKKFGFFFEHQGRFNEKKYSAAPTKLFEVTNCQAEGNLFGFGTICSINTVYENCQAEASLRYGFVFADSQHSKAVDCTSEKAGEASFAILQTVTNGETDVSYISILDCVSRMAPIGVKISGENPSAHMMGNRVGNSVFEQTAQPIYTSGKMQNLTLSGNRADSAKNSFHAEIKDFKNTDNSWNKTNTDSDQN